MGVLQNIGFKLLGITILFWGLSPDHTSANNSDLHLELELSQQLADAQRLDINRLGIDTRGQGDRIARLILENNSAQPLDELYFHIQIEVSGVGIIAELDQDNNYPFSLEPHQTVMVNNNDLSRNGLPGVSEEIRFDDAGLTPQGEDFVSELEGSTRLPNRVYSVTVNIYQGGNRFFSDDGPITTASSSIGATSIGGTDISINLLSPGDQLGSETTIHSTRPVFNWDGDEADQYRLVVVEDTGDDPESLIQNALSTDPTIGGDGIGDLLDFEMADAVITDRTSFNYPITDVQSLEEGERYFWQIFTIIQTGAGEMSIPSEIWEFSIAGRDEQIMAGMQQQTEEMLAELLSEEELEELASEGFELEAIEIDGQRYSGAELEQMLRQIARQKREGEISLSR